MTTFSVSLNVTSSGANHTRTLPQLPDVTDRPLGASGLALVSAGRGVLAGAALSPHSAGKIVLISLGSPVSTHQKKLSHARSDCTLNSLGKNSRLSRFIHVNRFWISSKNDS